MTPKRQNWYAEIAVAILLVALIFLSVFLVRQYRSSVWRGIVSGERASFSSLVHRHSLGAKDTGLIEPWMTFGYVSISFKVPASYLVTALGIASSTPKYPNITLGYYAKTIATSSRAMAEDVGRAVHDYLMVSP